MSKVYNIDDFRQNEKRSTVKDWLHDKAWAVRDWYFNNKDLVTLVGPAAIGATTTLVKVVGKTVNLHKEKNVKELYCYDRSLGHYWALRRELSNKEWVEIDRRKQNGERLADILTELKVLK